MLRCLLMVLAFTVTGAAGAAEPALDGGAGSFPLESFPTPRPFKIAPREDKLWHYPCMKCHADRESNPQRRVLDAKHLDELDHGKGQMWCLDCHDAGDMNFLRTVSGERVEFDQAYLICGSCHAYRQRDWYNGAHGKRVGNWQGERVIYNCTHCHDPHEPAIETRAPEPPPPVRAGLERQRNNVAATVPLWERRSGKTGGHHDEK